MSARLQLMIAAAAISAIVVANGAAANIRSDSASIVREIGRAAPVIGIRADQGLLEDFVARGAERDGSHIAQTGIWSGIKSEAKSIGGKVKSAARTVNSAIAKAGGKVMDKARRAIELNERVKGAIKKAVIGTAKKIAKKIKSKF